MKRQPHQKEIRLLEDIMHKNHAQIFQSFDALKGFRELLAQQEQIHVPKRELSEDQRDELDWKLRQIKVGSMIRIVYRKDQDYIQLEGIVSKLNIDMRMLQIVKKKIDLLSIVEIDLLENQEF